MKAGNVLAREDVQDAELSADQNLAVRLHGGGSEGNLGACLEGCLQGDVVKYQLRHLAGRAAVGIRHHHEVPAKVAFLEIGQRERWTCALGHRLAVLPPLKVEWRG